MMIKVILSVIVLLIAAVAAWYDYRFYIKKWRIAVILISGLMLVGFINEPKWWYSGSANYALFTEGFSETEFNEAKYDSVYSIRPEDKSSRQRKWLSSASMLMDYIPQGSHIDLYGHGVMEDLPNQFIWGDNLRKPAKGIVLNSAPHQVETGKEFSIELTLKGAVKGDSVLIYKDAGLWENRKVDSSGTLVLTDKLYTKGPVSYEFEWVNSDTVISETLRIRAVQPPLLTAGILTYSPSFEINYLAEHLGERGHTIISRNRIGQDRFRYDVINTEIEQAQSILEQLSDIDLLVLDAREYLQLSNSEQNRIQDAVEMGLDILLNPPASDAPENWEQVVETLGNQEVELQLIERLEERNWIPKIFEDQQSTISAIPLLNMNFSDQPEEAAILHQYGANDPVSIRIKNGAGSITGQIFYHTYRWLIEGESETYNRFWVDYLSNVITVESSQIALAPLLPKINEKLTIAITQPQEFGKALVKSVYEADSLEIPITQSPQNFAVSTASYWSQNTGWHFVEHGDSKKWFYVYGNDDWEFDTAFDRYRKTSRFISNKRMEGDLTSTFQRTAVPNWLWLIGFLILQIFLWAERKFR